MSDMVQVELDVAGGVPQAVKDRVRASLDGRGIDCSDIPGLMESGSQPMNRTPVGRCAVDNMMRDGG